MISSWWIHICILVLLTDHSCSGYYYNHRIQRFIHSLFQTHDTASSPLIFDSKYVTHQLRGGETREVDWKNDSWMRSSDSYQNTTVSRRPHISVQEMEQRLQALKNRKPSYLHAVSKGSIIPPLPPPPPPPPISKYDDGIKHISVESKCKDDNNLPCDTSLETDAFDPLGQTDKISESDDTVGTDDSLNHTFEISKEDSTDMTDPILKSKKSSVVKIPESTVSNCKKIAKTFKVLSNIGGKAFSYVSGMVLLPEKDASLSWEKQRTNPSKSKGKIHDLGTFKLVSIDISGNEKPWERHQGNALLDIIDLFALHFNLWSMKVPGTHLSGLSCEDDEPSFLEPILDSYDVSEADDSEVVDTPSYINSGILTSTVNKCLMQSIIPILHEYTNSYMMHMPIRTKRSTKVVTKSIRVRETLLSQLDTSNESLDISKKDFERLLLELSSGPSEEIIEEVEYEYDEWPQHYEMLENMKDEILSVVTDTNYFIKGKTDDESIDGSTSRNENGKTMCHRVGIVDDIESQYYDGSSLSDIDTADESEESFFYGLSEDEYD